MERHRAAPARLHAKGMLRLRESCSGAWLCLEIRSLQVAGYLVASFANALHGRVLTEAAFFKRGKDAQ